jgi:hypothetical protein
MIIVHAAKLPQRVSVEGTAFKYVNVDPATGINPNGTWMLIGTDSDGKGVRMFDVPSKRIRPYQGPDSDYDAQRRARKQQEQEKKKAEEEAKARQQQEAQAHAEEDVFLGRYGLSRRKLRRPFYLSGIPSLKKESLSDPVALEQAVRVLKQQTGEAFTRQELGQVSDLALLNDSTVEVRRADPAAGLLEVFSPVLGESMMVSPKVLKAFSSTSAPRLPSEVAQLATRKALMPYRDEQGNIPAPSELSREMLAARTPALARYIAANPDSVRLAGQIYENYGVQRYGDPLGETYFARDMGMFGLDADMIPEDSMYRNPTRGLASDEGTRGSWTGEVYIYPEAGGRVPDEVIADAMDMAQKSTPFVKVQGEWVKAGEEGRRSLPEEFVKEYKGGPVMFYSTDLFRHVVGLGKFGNDWSVPAASEAPASAVSEPQQRAAGLAGLALRMA